MTINELIIKKENELTEEQIKFLNVHNDILTCGSIISNSLVNLAINLKKMKDEELYLEAGYSTFEDYTEQACGLKQRQAYNYIKVLDKLGEDFLHSNAKIGIAKLTLLTTLSDEEKSKLTDEVNVEDTSVSELKAKIKELQEQNDLKDKSIEKKDKIIAKNNKDISNLNCDLSNLKKNLEIANKREVEVVIQDSEDTLNKVKDLENQLTKTKQEVLDLNNQRDSLAKKLEISNSKYLVEFKILFDNLQDLIGKIKDLVPLLPEEKQDGCKSALNKVGLDIC